MSDFTSASLFSSPWLIGAASEFWMTRWLTAYWLLGVGIIAGLLALVALVGLFWGLAQIPALEKLRRSGGAFVLGLIVTSVLTMITGWSIRGWFEIGGEVKSNEWFLMTAAIFPIMLIVVWAFLYCGQKRFLGELWGTLSSGIGAQLAGVVLAVGLTGLICWPLVDEPNEMLLSFPTLFGAGKTVQTVEIPGNTETDDSPAPYLPAGLSYDPIFVSSITVESDRNIIIADADSVENFRTKPFRVEARSPAVWRRGSSGEPPIPMIPGSEVFVQNLEIDPAKISFELGISALYPEVQLSLLSGLIVVWLGLAWMLAQAAAPKMSAIAMSTAKSEISQPLPLFLLGLGCLLIVAFVFLPFHTEGEDIKLLKECGLTVILILSLFQGIWSASNSVSDEIEGRTALTLLSKPIRRRSFILGKMLGITWVLLLFFLVLGAVLLLSVAYKPIYDARETSQEMPLWQECFREMIRTGPGLLMYFLEAVTLSTIAVALATRVPQLANFAICFSIYLVGHLTPSIVGSSGDAFPIIQFVAQLIAVIVPTLDWFSMDKAIDTGNPIPLVYLATVIIYSLLYTTFAVFLGLLLFEDRDLA